MKIFFKENCSGAVLSKLKKKSNKNSLGGTSQAARQKKLSK
jgi:hypothetical protein